MITKQTVVDQIEVTSTARVQFRLGLLLVEDGKVLDLKRHRSAIDPGGKVSFQIEQVNNSLDQLGYPRLRREQLGTLQAIVELVHTPEVIANFLQTQAKASENIP